MNNKITKKIIAGLMLTTFLFTNSSLSAYAILSQNNSNGAIKLNADIAIKNADSRVSLSLRDSDVKQVLRMFADKANMNIIFAKGVSDEKITLDLVDVPLSAAFEMVLNISELNYVVESNTLIISGGSSSGKANAIGTQEIASIQVKYIDASTMADFLNENIFSMQKAGLSGSKIVTTNPMTNELLVFGTKNDVALARKVVEKFDKKPVSATIKINHTTPKQMAESICNILIPATSGSTGGAAPISGVMTGAADEIELGAGEVACKIGGKSSGDFKSMPLQSLIVSYFTTLGTISIMGGSSEQLEMIQEFVKANDRKQPQAYLEVSILELNESGSKELQNTWKYISQNFSFNAADGTSSIGSPFPIFFRGDSYDNYKDITSSPTAVTQYPGKTALVYAVNYILKNSKGRVVANPRIIVTNGQESTIDLTSEYIDSVTSQIIDTSFSGAWQKTYNKGSDNGIKVSVTPFISPDGYVTLNIAPNYGTIKETITALNADGVPEIQATLLQKRNLDLKNIRIKDGETLILGGMIKEDETKTVKKIPFLGDIPVLGMFFRSTTSTKAKEEMIIMVTPKIIVDSEDVENETTL